MRGPPRKTFSTPGTFGAQAGGDSAARTAVGTGRASAGRRARTLVPPRQELRRASGAQLRQQRRTVGLRRGKASFSKDKPHAQSPYAEEIIRREALCGQADDEGAASEALARESGKRVLSQVRSAPRATRPPLVRTPSDRPAPAAPARSGARLEPAQQGKPRATEFAPAPTRSRKHQFPESRRGFAGEEALRQALPGNAGRIRGDRSRSGNLRVSQARRLPAKPSQHLCQVCAGSQEALRQTGTHAQVQTRRRMGLRLTARPTRTHGKKAMPTPSRGAQRPAPAGDCHRPARPALEEHAGGAPGARGASAFPQHRDRQRCTAPLALKAIEGDFPFDEEGPLLARRQADPHRAGAAGGQHTASGGMACDRLATPFAEADVTSAAVAGLRPSPACAPWMVEHAAGALGAQGRRGDGGARPSGRRSFPTPDVKIFLDAAPGGAGQTGGFRQAAPIDPQTTGAPDRVSPGPRRRRDRRAAAVRGAGGCGGDATSATAATATGPSSRAGARPRTRWLLDVDRDEPGRGYWERRKRSSSPPAAG